MENKIKKTTEQLKKLENVYQISRDWNYNEKYTEQEYTELIDEYVDYTPLEIVDEICKIIRKL